MASASWDVGESGGGVACCRPELAKKRISEFEKTNLRNFIYPVGDTVEKANSEVDDVASEGGED